MRASEAGTAIIDQSLPYSFHGLSQELLLQQTSSGMAYPTAALGFLGMEATHPLLQLDPSRLQVASGMAGVEGSQHNEHPLLAFDPLAGTSSSFGDPILPDVSPQNSQLRLQSTAPPDFASELEFHGSPLAPRYPAD